MMMDKVYYLKEENNLKTAASKVLKDSFTPGETVVTKIHFGEPGNKTAFKPDDIVPIIDSLNENNLKTLLIDTPVAYTSPRHTVLGYNLVIKQRGFTKISPCKVSNSYKKIKTKNLEVEASIDLLEAKNVLVISHVKGHPCTGFGGAIKNLGMGGVSIKSKNDQHNLSKPEVRKNCVGCGQCVPLCPGKAIKVEDSQAKVNANACWGCSICELACPNEALEPKVALFDDLIAQAASALINNFPRQAFYINYIKRLSKNCDCSRNGGEIIAPDVGILFSDNPVAIDKATLDLTVRETGEDPFFKTHHKDALVHIKFASEYTKRSMDYELVEV